MSNDAVVRTLLSSLRTSLRKEYPHLVDEVRFEFGHDQDGEDAVFVTVILKDRKPKGDYRWGDVQPVERIIRQQVASKEPSPFPYVRFQLKSELAQTAA
ncbi:MAG: hypothetical protein MUC96_23410 [Myxococcaceae bacterium]|jgi:hypothetical protein|nr:hypothetical protein [Myxococcaceae bacterium]